MSEHKVVCPVCAEQGLKSTIKVGSSSTYGMSWTPYYDEEGNYHSHNPNALYSGPRCSRGHHLEIRMSRPCPCETCDYGKGGPSVKAREPRSGE